ncbi:MAG: phosphatidylserine decarboxylase family protein [Candidatus Magnetoovum sp. WYHC-5]|nr:phosphatidylserine decarboxylase family protein [Candidatus Magnetoovum sp. WYHC-5]
MPGFAPEGYPFIGGAFILFTIVLYFTGNVFYNAVPFTVFLFMLYFFRDPDRDIPPDEFAIVSPADGKILAITEVFEDTFLKEQVRKISIFMSPLNVHVNRAPLAGKVKTVVHKAGSFKKAFLEEASIKNENISMVIETKIGNILVRQVAGALARRAVCRVSPGDLLERGQRYGIIKFSSRVDLYLPLNVDVVVRKDMKVLAGETIIARFDKK